MAVAGTVVIEMDANTAKLVKGVKNTQKQLSSLQKSVKSAKNSLKNMGSVIGAIGIGYAARSLGRYADQYKNLSSQVGLVTTGLSNQKLVQQELLSLSNQSRVGLEGTTTLYAKLARSTEGLGYSQKSLLTATETISKALTISGASAVESSAAITQLGQGLASGVLRGEELNSVMEQTPRLAKLISDGMGISIGQLRKVASEGKITSQVVLDAVASQTGVINDEFGNIATTIGQANTVFENTFLTLVGRIDEVTGASNSMAEAISAGATFIGNNTDLIAQGFLGIKLVFQVMKQDFYQVVVWIDDGIQRIGQGWNTLTATMQNVWKTMADATGKAFYGVVNYILDLVNTTVNSVSSALGGAFEYLNVDNPFQPINLSIGEYTSTIKEAKAETFKLLGTDWAKTNLNESAKGTLKTYKQLRDGITESSKASLKDLATKGKVNKQLINNAKKSTKATKANTKALTDAQKEAKKLQDQLNETAESFGGIFQQGFESILRGDFAGGLADILGDAMQSATSSVAGTFSKGLGNVFSGAGSFSSAFTSFNPLDIIGSAVSVIGGLFSNTLSQSEIDNAKGVQKFDTKALTDIKSILEDNQAPQLTATKSMLDHLESMDTNLLSALSSVTNGGLDLGGQNYENTSSGNWWGGTSKELIGAGLQFAQDTVKAFVDGTAQIDAYEAVKKTSSSFFGLVSKESISTKLTPATEKLRKQIGSAIGDSVQVAMEAVEVLGFDSSAIKAQLDQFALDLGKVNFKDLNGEEKAQALRDAISGQLDTALGSAISAVADPSNVSKLNSLIQANEEYMTGIVRLATQQEVVSTQLSLFGQTVTDFAASDALVQAAGGLDKFKNAMQIFTQNFFSEEEQQAMQKQQLELALAVQNIALPASKAQFRALVLETQQKIISVKANIETMKASIRADIEANNYKKLANEEYVRSAISTANNIQQASILIGTSAHDMIEAAKGSKVEAKSLDYTSAYESDIGLQALEGELKNLESIYGTLLDNMGAFADYYNTAESLASDIEAKAKQKAEEAARLAREKLNNTRKTQIELINKEITLRNKLNSTIASMQDSVYGSFEKLLGKDVPQLVNDLRSAINNKEYGKVSGAFNDYTSKLQDTAGSKEQFLRGIIGANALVQSVQGQEQMTLLDSSLATEANTRETAYLQRISLGLSKDKIASTEKDNKLDRNNELLEELISLQKTSNAQGATGLDLQAEKNRDDVASELRARYIA